MGTAGWGGDEGHVWGGESSQEGLGPQKEGVLWRLGKEGAERDLE